MPTGVIIIGMKNTTRKKRRPAKLLRAQKGQAQADQVLDGDSAEDVDQGDAQRAELATGAAGRAEQEGDGDQAERDHEAADHGAGGRPSPEAATAGHSAKPATEATNSQAVGEGARLPRRWNCCEPNSSFLKLAVPMKSTVKPPLASLNRDSEPERDDQREDRHRQHDQHRRQDEHRRCQPFSPPVAGDRRNRSRYLVTPSEPLYAACCSSWPSSSVISLQPVTISLIASSGVVSPARARWIAVSSTSW